jgi:Pyruvate/2-oxoacid:ferredoxin oxidoreductase delta subunit
VRGGERKGEVRRGWRIAIPVEHTQSNISVLFCPESCGHIRQFNVEQKWIGFGYFAPHCRGCVLGRVSYKALVLAEVTVKKHIKRTGPT